MAHFTGATPASSPLFAHGTLRPLPRSGEHERCLPIVCQHDTRPERNLAIATRSPLQHLTREVDLLSRVHIFGARSGTGRHWQAAANFLS